VDRERRENRQRLPRLDGVEAAIERDTGEERDRHDHGERGREAPLPEIPVAQAGEQPRERSRDVGIAARGARLCRAPSVRRGAHAAPAWIAALTPRLPWSAALTPR